MTTRRAFLQRSALAGLGAAAGLTWPRTARASEEGLLLVVWVQGGWDPSFVFDPHFESGALDRDPASEPATSGGISHAAAASRPSVTRFFENYGHRAVVVNGLAVGSISHSQCTRLALTASRRPDAPDLATRIAASGGDWTMPHLVVSGPRFPGALGAHVVPLNPLLTGTVRGDLPRGAAPHPDQEAAIRGFLASEAEALSATPAAAAYRDGLRRLDALEAAIDAVYLGETPTDEQLLDAGVAALGQGLSRCVTVAAGLPFMSQWDSHANNRSLQDRNHERLFADLDRLMGQLAATPGPSGAGSLSDVTTVLVMSEMGRTPVENANGGKDHWPYTSLLMLGPGLAGGRVVGATDAALVGQPVDPVSGTPSAAGAVLTPAALGAGLVQHLGLDPAEHFPGAAPFSAPYA